MVRRASFVAKPIILALGSVVVIVLFFLLPPNKEWAKERIFSYRRDFQWQRKRLDIEDRKRIRLESAYTVSVDIASILEKRGHKKDALVLLPPNNYFKMHGFNYHVPEPAVFYYFTGLNTVWANNSNAADANWYVRVQDGAIIIDSVINKKDLTDTIAAFKKLGITL